MKMSELPSRVYRCADMDEARTLPNHNMCRPKSDSFTTKLRELAINESYIIPKSSIGIVSRVARRTGFKFKNEQLPETAEVRVRRIK